jgi:hypothetical protein
MSVARTLGESKQPQRRAGMRNLAIFIAAIIVVATAGAAVTEGERAPSIPRADNSMPSTHRVMVNAHDLSVQAYDAY